MDSPRPGDAFREEQQRRAREIDRTNSQKAGWFALSNVVSIIVAMFASLEHFPFICVHGKCSISLFAEQIHASGRCRSTAICSRSWSAPGSAEAVELGVAGCAELARLS